ncbi:cytochrome P450 [Roridomyces roridus]|uniref:Cytochrome P450 n=1 Tax=Roridomyces roridus TaxID=1738132 RepID=A0AAD7BSF0_9AGAR|nr:cytochrome P450 [Roridomyces roridus]
MFLAHLLLGALGALVLYAVLYAAYLVYRELASPLRPMRGPRNPSLLFGNLKEISSDLSAISDWRAQFGPTFQFRGFFSMSHICTTDLKALTHIVTDDGTYRKPAFVRDMSRRMLGKGLLFAQLDDHKRQRRAMNPAFGAQQIRVLTDVFFDKAIQLREIWAIQVSQAQENGTECQIEVFDWLRRVTLDVIGQAGFDYQFNALTPQEEPSELSTVFTKLLHSPHAQRYMNFRRVQSLIPIFKLVPVPGGRMLRRARNAMAAIGAQIVARSKARLLADNSEKTLSGRRDLVSVLLKSNVSASVPGNQRLSESEVIAQIPTFLFAGHETTSSALAWALQALSLNPTVQTKLRAELFKISTEAPTMNDLNALPYLENVVRETMRLHTPVVFNTRVAMRDDMLPLSTPYVDRFGKKYDSLPIPKGQMFYIPILGVNTDEQIWGTDALEFRPERWDRLPEGVSDIPGVWANQLTFFGGTHNCIGFRFALAEIKVILFTLLRAFEFKPAVPKEEIVLKLAGFFQRPGLRGAGSKGSELPMLLNTCGSNYN